MSMNKIEGQEAWATTIIVAQDILMSAIVTAQTTNP